MLLLLIVGLLEGITADLRVPTTLFMEPVNKPRPMRTTRRRMTPEWPTGFV